MSAPEADAPALTERMLEVVAEDDVESLSTLLAAVVAPSSPRGHLLEPVLGELVRIVTALLRERTGGEAMDGPAFTADLLDTENRPFAIDDVDPALRAVLRAVLARLNGDPGDAAFQLGLVTRDPEPLSRLDAVWHLLLWASVLGDRNA
ncbi:hypothetical protein [Saccharomonospora saliphila]|uniref:hypothetical protein n=1 Tax=Saccharomonospora saliphila TaxID=369829 RepID=UPI0003715701|nr:hypothetical protein [Saccharomonospora saliphila]